MPMATSGRSEFAGKCSGKSAAFFILPLEIAVFCQIQSAGDAGVIILCHQKTEPGARVLLLDGSDLVAGMGPDEIGAELMWQASPTDEAERRIHEDAGGLPWPVCHVRVADGTLSWVRRGADLPGSWALPEGDNSGHFAVAFDTGAGFASIETVDVPFAAIPAGAIAAQVAEIGADGRTGRWVSISLGTP